MRYLALEAGAMAVGITPSISSKSRVVVWFVYAEDAALCETVVGERIMILRSAICLAAMMLLEGCAAGLLTAGAATGFAVDQSVDQGARYGIRRLDNSMQARIAAAAGPLGVGYAASWDSPQWIPIFYPAHSGMVEVVRIFGRLTTCKEVIFTIKDNYNVFTTTICLNENGDWAWALAEPSIHR